MSAPPTHTFDPRDDAVVQCPFPHWARLRAEGPVHPLDGDMVGRPGEVVYAVSRFDLVSQVLLDWRTYSSRFGSPAGTPPLHLSAALKEITSQGWQRPPTMLTADPPTHTRYRRLVSKAFTPRRVAELAPTIERICTDLCDAMDAAGDDPVELVERFCVPIPTRTIAAALGVPQERFGDFKRWADASTATIGRQLDDEAWLESARGVVELQQYFAAEFDARRSQPRDDLLTDLLRARLSPEDEVAGEPLSTGELISIVQQLQVAGSETTASLIADIVVQLDQHQEEWDRLGQDPGRYDAVVEEALRLASPTQGMFRIATMDTELGGVPIPSGTTLWILFGAANRDAAVFDRPDDLDSGRAHPSQHLAFGKGPHYCVGAPLARLEATTALRVLAARYARVVVAKPAGLRYIPSSMLRGLERLDVHLLRRDDTRTMPCSSS